MTLAGWCLPASAEAALSRTDLKNEFYTIGVGNAVAATTTSFTPPNNSLLVVVTNLLNDDDGDNMWTNNQVTGGGLTWTQRAHAQGTNAGFPEYNSGLEIWTAPVTTGSSMTVTAANSNGVSGSAFSDGARIGIQIMAFTGYDSADPIGVATSSNNIGNTTGNMTLPSTTDLTSTVLAARSFVAATTDSTSASPGTGWTEVYDYATANGYGELQTQVRVSSTSAAVYWTDINVNDAPLGWTNGVAMEINAAQLPTVSTIAASNIGAASANLRGNITSNGGASITQHGFAYATSSGLTSNVSTTTLGTGTTGTYSQLLSSLLENTTYYFRAYAANSVGTTTGSIFSFTTGNDTPARTMRLFEGTTLKFYNGAIRIYEQ